jgi:hypothetical protein
MPPLKHNLTIIEHIAQESTNCTSYELFLFPICLLILIGLCVFICAPIINTLEILNAKCKIYDESQVLLHKKENV